MSDNAFAAATFPQSKVVYYWCKKSTVWTNLIPLPISITPPSSGESNQLRFLKCMNYFVVCIVSVPEQALL